MSVRDEEPPAAADDAARLLRGLGEAAATWARTAAAAGAAGRAHATDDLHRDAAGPPGGSEPPGGSGQAAQGSAHPPTCTVCPLCIAARRLQAAHPEVVDHLRDAAGSLLAAVAVAVGDRADPADPADPADRTDRTDRAASPEPSPHVEHIPVLE